MDRALWITWYDLPEQGRSEHAAWVKERYMPRLLDRRGVSWAAHFQSEKSPPMSGIAPGAPSRLHSTDDPAVPRGNAYILIFGAASSRRPARRVPSSTG